MKKYLIKGALALFAGTLVLSCAEKESEYVPLAQQKAQSFEEVFKEVYGDIDPYQDWGFSSGKITIDPNDTSAVVDVIDLDGDIAYTRTRAFNGADILLAFHSKTRADASGGENKNLNEWGDPAKNNGVAYDVPDALTDQQKLRVRKYFQAHPNLGYKDPGYTTFFVQQVYKGDPKTAGSLSPEQYTLGNGDVVTGSNHMDHLTFGLKSDGTARHHVNDFNHGDWNGGVAYEVLNTGHSANEYKGSTTHVEGSTHPDQITLMVNSSTERVGYAESNASVQHNYCCALASAAAIDKWAVDSANSVGATVDDKWHRSFVGLDYEAVEDPYVYVNGSRVAAKVGDVYNSVSYAWTGTTYVRFDDALKNQTLKQYFNLNEEVYYLQTNKNNWAGNASNLSGQDALLKKNVSGETLRKCGLTDAVNSSYDVLDLTVIKNKVVNEHCSPVSGKGLVEWYNGLGARDYVFSDWIVTLTNAGTVPVTTNTFVTDIDTWTQVESGRVFCEDLGVASREDLDYNDVVFDATIWENKVFRKEWWEKYVNGVKVDSGLVEGVDKQIPETINYYASVTLLAAGGTIPITVHGVQVHSQFVAPATVPAAVETMINTRDDNSTAYGSFDTRDPVQLQGTDMVVRNYKLVKSVEKQNETYYTLKMFPITMPSDGQAINSIEIVSSYGTAKQVLEIKSVRGSAPRKFMVPNDLPNHPERIWPTERKNISLAYPLFGQWVQGKKTLEECFFGAFSVNTDYTYKGANYTGNKLPLVLKAQRTIVTDGEEYLWMGNLEFKDSWSLRVPEVPAFSNNQQSSFTQFCAGDRLRFRASGIGAEAWISVSIGDITPYFVDSEFPNYIYNADGKKEARTEGCVEVILDDSAAELLNKKVSGGTMSFTVKGRSFTLTGITWVPAK